MCAPSTSTSVIRMICVPRVIELEVLADAGANRRSLVAGLAYAKPSLRKPRAFWINLDLIWGGALMVTGLATLIFGN